MNNTSHTWIGPTGGCPGAPAGVGADDNLWPFRGLESSSPEGGGRAASAEIGIEVSGLCHRYGSKTVYEDLTFSVDKGAVCGLLGKNGQGKSTLVNILMGFLKPVRGVCRVLGEDSHDLSPLNRGRIGLLHEGHLAYDFLTIEQSERFYGAFYPEWQADRFYDLVDRMGMPRSSRLNRLSCGQRSQVVLGLIMAQNPDLLILDDFSLGLDAGYRRLFLEVLHDFTKNGDKTVFVTSHIVQDLENLVDQIIFIDRGRIWKTRLAVFLDSFKRYECIELGGRQPVCDAVVRGVERRNGSTFLYSFSGLDELIVRLEAQGCGPVRLQRRPMTLEDGFVGLLGHY